MSIRAGFIGVGGISHVHLSYLKSRDDVEIVALSDPNYENLQKRLDEFGGTGYPDYRLMLEKESLDAVWICTPPQIRQEPILDSVDRGLAVFCEKPVEHRLEKARAIAAELKKRPNALVQIGYVFRAMPIIAALREKMADDAVWLIQSFYGSPMSRTLDMPAWFYDKSKSGGGLVDQATHNFDLFRFLFGEVDQIKGIAANPVHPKKSGYTIEEVIALNFQFENGALGAHLHTWLADRWRNELLFVGEKRVYRIDIWTGSLSIEEDNHTEIIRQDMDKMYHHENARFLELVESRDPAQNICSFEEGLKTLELVLACDRAVEM